MTIGEFLSYSFETQIKRFRASASDDVDVEYTARQGHLLERHADLSREELIERVLLRQKGSSSFETKKSALLFLSDVLYAKANEIVKWICTCDRDNAPNLTLTANMGEYVGSGMTEHFAEKETEAVTLVLKWNPSHKIGNGCLFFNVVTFYPELSHDKAYEVGRVEPEEIETAANKLSDPLMRGLWSLWGAGYNPVLRDGLSGEFVETRFSVGGRLYNVTCNDRTTYISRPRVALVEPRSDGNPHFRRLERISEDEISPEERLEVMSVAQGIVKAFAVGVHEEVCVLRDPKAYGEDGLGDTAGDGWVGELDDSFHDR